MVLQLCGDSFVRKTVKRNSECGTKPMEKWCIPDDRCIAAQRFHAPNRFAYFKICCKTNGKWYIPDDRCITAQLNVLPAEHGKQIFDVARGCRASAPRVKLQKPSCHQWCGKIQFLASPSGQVANRSKLTVATNPTRYSDFCTCF